MKGKHESQNDVKQGEQVPPAQRLVVVLFLLGATLTPLFGLFPFMMYYFVLIFSVRSVKGFNANRGMFVVPSYLKAINSTCNRLLAWVLLGAFIVIGHVVSAESYDAILDADSHVRPILISIFFALVAGHMLLLTRITWHLYRGREETQGRYIDFGQSIVRRLGGFSEKPTSETTKAKLVD